jgi:hypothetical protein
MNTKALTISALALALGAGSYLALNTLYPFKQTVEVLEPAISADQVYAGHIEVAPQAASASAPAAAAATGAAPASP